MKVSSVIRPKTAKSKTNKGRSKKPIDKKILENNWNPQTSTAYGVKFNGIEKPSPVKHKERKGTELHTKFNKILLINLLLKMFYCIYIEIF